MSEQQVDLMCTLTVVQPDIDPTDDPTEEDAEYIAIIDGKCRIYYDYFERRILRGSLVAKRIDVNGDVDITFNIDNLRNRYYIDSEFEYEGNYGYYDLDSSILYGYNLYEGIIDSTCWFPIKLDHDICDGIVSIDYEQLSDTNPCDLDITFKIDALPIMHEVVEGQVELLKNYYTLLCFSPIGAIVELLPTYYSGKDSAEIDCVLDTAKFKRSSDLYVRFHVHRKKSIYSLFTKFRVVPRVDRDLFVNFTVINDQIYDIMSTVSMDRNDMSIDVNGSTELPPYTVNQILGLLNIEGIDTRRDIPIYFYAVTPVNNDVYIHMNIETPYTPGFVDIPIGFRVGNTLGQDILYTRFCVESAIQQNNEIPIKFFVKNWRYPGRIVIAVDPVWHYEPFVLKSALITFLDRVYRRTNLTVIYGGNPRSDWDINHLCKVFDVQDGNLINCPLVYDAHNPCYMKETVDNFIATMCRFNDCQRKTIDRVFLFMDNPIYHRSTVLGPIMDFCQQYGISCVAIDSHGDYQEICNPVSETQYLRFHNTNIPCSNTMCPPPPPHNHCDPCHHHHFSICRDDICNDSDIVY